jgi:ribosomal protein L21
MPNKVLHIQMKQHTRAHTHTCCNQNLRAYLYQKNGLSQKITIFFEKMKKESHRDQGVLIEYCTI